MGMNMDNPTSLALRIKTLGCKVTTEEYSKFKDLADLAHISMSDYFRAAIMNNETFVVQREIISKDKRQLIYLFGKTSNNLNQLAKSVNIATKKNKIDNALCLRLLRELQLIQTDLETYIEAS